jgi:electron transport complex protein RnfC
LVHAGFHRSESSAEKQAADLARERYEFRLYRIERDKAERGARLLANQAAKAGSATVSGNASGTMSASDITRAVDIPIGPNRRSRKNSP